MCKNTDMPAKTSSEMIIRPGRESLSSQIAEFAQYRELLYFFVWKNLKVRYSQAILGASWALLQPLLTASILALLLGRFARVPTDGASPFLFYLAAMVPWTYFASAVTTATASLVNNQALILKIYFPRLCLPVAGVLSALVDLAVPLTVLLGVIAVTGRADVFPGALVAVPLLLLVATMAAAGLGIGLAALNLRFRDVTHILPFVIQTLFFASPIIYSASQLPESLRLPYFLNPMAAVIDGFRAVLLQTHPFSWMTTALGTASAAAMLLLGVIYFERTQHRFADVA